MSEKLTQAEWDAINDAIQSDRESMEDDGDPCFDDTLAALSSAEDKIVKWLR